MSIATDHALATIASILTPRGAVRDRPKPAPSEIPASLAKPAAKVAIEPAGYSRTGPGPMAAIRIKWTVRRGDDGYYVDETIGAGSVPVVNGPLSGEAAISFVDARVREAQLRFDALRNEITGRGSVTPILALGGET
jgi:hypothetical protein